jgi:catechol 2,3-dioxygenase-like lactoylglutathione lyase family enzyme
MLLRMNCVIVFCSDMARSVAFYRDKMGFPVKRWSEKWTELHTGPATLTLHLALPSRGDKWTRGAFQSGQAHPSFEVLDLDRFYEEKKSKGIDFLLPPTKKENEPKMAVLLDPDGMPICVTEAGS